jgi:tetratricopeptide (TPR) repeat protein
MLHVALAGRLLLPSQAVAQPSSSAATDDRARARQLYAEGSAAFQRGDFEAAVRGFEAAYALDPHPALLLNIAQAHRLEQPPDCGEALRHYEMFLAAVPRAPERPEIEAYAAEMRRCIAATARPRDPSAPPAKDAIVAPAPAAPPPARSNRALWLVGTGVVLAAAGGGLWAAARRKHDELAPTCPCDPATLDRWQTITRVGYGLTAGGLALTAGALVWWTLGRSRGSAPAELAAAVGPDAGWVVVKGAF